MLDKTRISSTPDVGRIAEALSRPGIDPRTWCSLAVVDAVGFDAEHGYFADVVLIGGEAAGAKSPARVAAAYAGPGFGFFLPLEVDDEVVVAFPNGDPAAGLVVVGRMHDHGTPPPAEVADRQADLLLLAKDGATVRVATQGAGNIVVEPRGTGKVLLGSEAATRGAARLSDEVTIPVAALTALLDSHYLVTGVPIGTSAKGTITSASGKVKVEG
jgi:hypothetical protein